MDRGLRAHLGEEGRPRGGRNEGNEEIGAPEIPSQGDPGSALASGTMPALASRAHASWLESERRLGTSPDEARLPGRCLDQGRPAPTSTPYPPHPLRAEPRLWQRLGAPAAGCGRREEEEAKRPSTAGKDSPEAPCNTHALHTRTHTLILETTLIASLFRECRRHRRKIGRARSKFQTSFQAIAAGLVE